MCQRQAESAFDIVMPDTILKHSAVLEERAGGTSDRIDSGGKNKNHKIASSQFFGSTFCHVRSHTGLVYHRFWIQTSMSLPYLIIITASAIHSTTVACRGLSRRIRSVGSAYAPSIESIAKRKTP